jgi:hypothetical protein
MLPHYWITVEILDTCSPGLPAMLKITILWDLDATVCLRKIVGTQQREWIQESECIQKNEYIEESECILKSECIEKHECTQDRQRI